MDKEFQEKFAEVHKSIDKLAIMVASGFEQMEKRFERIENRLEQVENRLEQVENRLEQVEKRLDVIEIDIRELRAEARSIRAELNHVPDDVDATYAPTLNDLLERVSRIEKKIGLAV